MTDFVDKEEMDDYREMLQELLLVETGLSDGDIDFIESIDEWTGEFTVPQVEYLERIYERVL